LEMAGSVYCPRSPKPMSNQRQLPTSRITRDHGKLIRLTSIRRHLMIVLFSRVTSLMTHDLTLFIWPYASFNLKEGTWMVSNVNGVIAKRGMCFNRVQGSSVRSRDITRW
jgi:hypothetical protein